MKILLDVDGVIADCQAPIHLAAELHLGRPLPGPEHWHSFDFGESMRMTKSESRSFSAWVVGTNLPWHIKLYPYAEVLVARLQAIGEVVFVTSPWDGFAQWIPARRHLLEPFGLGIVFTHDKHTVPGDVLIDDKAETVLRNRSRGILWDQPWNRGVDGLTRAAGPLELISLVEAAKRDLPYRETLEEIR